MPKFRYTALGPGGKIIKGVMEVADRAALVDRLHAERQLPLEALAAESGGGILAFLNTDIIGDRRITARELTDFTRELAIMLGAGQDLDRALRFVVETTRARRAREIFADIRDRVRDGAALADALARYPSSFPRLYVGMVRAGEAGGALAETLERLATLLERERSLVASIHSALVYPALLVLTAISTVILLLVYVLPQFTPIFAQAGAQLPLATQILLDCGDAAQRYGAGGLVALVGLAATARQVLRQPAPRVAVDRWLMAAPFVGTLIAQIEAARLTRTLGTLLRNGVGMLAALGIVREVVGNRAVAQALGRAIAGVKEGTGLAKILAQTNAFPARTVDLLRLGEETGKLPETALRAAEIHEEQVRETVQRLMSLLVPLITIVTGIIVAGIISSLVVAMLSLDDLAL